MVALAFGLNHGYCMIGVRSDNGRSDGLYGRMS